MPTTADIERLIDHVCERFSDDTAKLVLADMMGEIGDPRESSVRELVGRRWESWGLVLTIRGYAVVSPHTPYGPRWSTLKENVCVDQGGRATVEEAKRAAVRSLINQLPRDNPGTANGGE